MSWSMSFGSLLHSSLTLRPSELSPSPSHSEGDSGRFSSCWESGGEGSDTSPLPRQPGEQGPLAVQAYLCLGLFGSGPLGLLGVRRSLLSLAFGTLHRRGRLLLNLLWRHNRESVFMAMLITGQCMFETNDLWTCVCLRVCVPCWVSSWTLSCCRCCRCWLRWARCVHRSAGPHWSGRLGHRGCPSASYGHYVALTSGGQGTPLPQFRTGQMQRATALQQTLNQRSGFRFKCGL